MQLLLVPLTQEILVAPPTRTSRIPRPTSTGTLPCVAPGSVSRESQELLLMVAESPSSIETIIYLTTQVQTSARVVMVSSKSPCAQLPVPRACLQPTTRYLAATSWKALGRSTHATWSRQPCPCLRVSRAPQDRTRYHTQARYGTLKMEKQNILRKLCSHFPKMEKK